MLKRREAGSIVSLLCDRGERYAHSYYNPEWLKSHGFDVAATRETIRKAAEQGEPLPPLDCCASDDRL